MGNSESRHGKKMITAGRGRVIRDTRATSARIL